MRRIWQGGLLVAILMLPGFSAADDKARDADSAWAKRVATEFFTAALTIPSDDDIGGNPVGFLCPELAAEVTAKDPASSLAKLAWQYQGGRFRIVGAEISPSGAEVVLTGELVPLSPEDRLKKANLKEGDESKLFGLLFVASMLGPMREVPADITVWLSKDSSGRWAIRYIRAKAREGKRDK